MPFRSPLLSRWILALSITALNLLFYVHFVMAYSVNVPYWDDWQFVDQIRRIQLGEVEWWSLLVSKHNEHLMGSAFLLEAFQLLLTDFNYKWQILAAPAIQGVSFLIILLTVRPSIPENRQPWWLIVSSLIWFSLSQYKDLLWGFQTAWFLVSLFLAITLVSLQRANRTQGNGFGETRIWFGVAVAAAVLASFAQFQGVIVWLAGGVYLAGCYSFKLHAALKEPLLRKWLLAAGLAGLLFGYVWSRHSSDSGAGSEKFSWRTVMSIFVGVHGDFWGDLGNTALLVVGTGMLVFVCFALMRVYISNDRSKYALPVSLIVFGTCFVSLVAIGRATYGLAAITDSHYNAYAVFTYFGALSIFMQRDQTASGFRSIQWIRSVYVVGIILATATSSYNGVLRGIEWRSDQGMAVSALLQYKEEPDFVLTKLLFGDAEMVRRNAAYMEANALGAFADRSAVPTAVLNYTRVPRSIKRMLEENPQHREAIRAMWSSYQIAGDLRRAFNPVSDVFATSLLDWTIRAIADTAAPHYVIPNVVRFSSDYNEIKQKQTK